MLHKLQESQIIDSYHLYEPNLDLHPSENESNKRNIGLDICRNNGCSHLLAMDADEFYKKEEFQYAKNMITDQNLVYTACQMATFFKKPIYQIKPEEDYFVSFITEIFDELRFQSMGNFPILVDPTRHLNVFNRNLGSKFYVFPRKELQMYHMSYVRKDINSKIQNSSSKGAMKDPDLYAKFFNTWKLGGTNMHPVQPELFEDVEVVDNFFEIEL